VHQNVRQKGYACRNPRYPCAILFGAVSLSPKLERVMKERFRLVQLGNRGGERGEKIISIEALLRIAKAVKTPIRDFFRDI
jgi:hypothetical protein